MKNTWQCLIATAVLGVAYTSAQSAIYMGTDAETPDTYQTQAAYPQGLKQASTPTNCELFYDGKGPLPPITCRTNTAQSVSATAKTTTPTATKPATTTSSTTANQKTTTDKSTAIAVKAAPKPAPKPVVPMMIYTVKPGSLKKNVETIVGQSHWGSVVWNLPFDYNWVGTTTLRAPDVQGILAQLLKPYPVEAVFYEQNHVVSVVARRDK